MQPVFRILLFAAIAIVPVTSFAGPEEIDFDKQIAPIFKMHCVTCHGSAKQQGGLRF